MPFDWGPHFIVPSESQRKFSGPIRLRERLDDGLLRKELDELGIAGAVIRITNPWYYRKKGTQSWIKIGESEDKQENFPVRWDTGILENGPYEVLGLMHVHIKKGDEEQVIARQNVVQVEIENR
jgi:hypothetical protein